MGPCARRRATTNLRWIRRRLVRGEFGRRRRRQPPGFTPLRRSPGRGYQFRPHRKIRPGPAIGGIGRRAQYFHFRLHDSRGALADPLAADTTYEVLQLLTGFAGTGIRFSDVASNQGSTEQLGFKKFNGAAGTAEEWGAARRSTCERCAATLARGPLAWS